MFERKSPFHVIDAAIGKVFPAEISATAEKRLKNFALALGIAGAIAIIFDAYPLTLYLSLPFCIIWLYCAWLHNEPQLKWINLVFTGIYVVGIIRYIFWYVL